MQNALSTANIDVDIHKITKFLQLIFLEIEKSKLQNLRFSAHNIVT